MIKVLTLGMVCYATYGTCSEIRMNEDIVHALKEFYAERDWHQFHSPKNLVMDLAAETGELVEIFRWMSEDESRKLDEKTMETVRGEIADIYKSIVYLTHVLGIDPVQASSQKLEEMRRKYPADAARGKILKYSAYEKQ